MAWGTVAQLSGWVQASVEEETKPAAWEGHSMPGLGVWVLQWGATEGFGAGVLCAREVRQCCTLCLGALPTPTLGHLPHTSVFPDSSVCVCVCVHVDAGVGAWSPSWTLSVDHFLSTWGPWGRGTSTFAVGALWYRGPGIPVLSSDLRVGKSWLPCCLDKPTFLPLSSCAASPKLHAGTWQVKGGRTTDRHPRWT